MVDGVKVGFIGMTLEGTPELVAPAGIAGLTFQDEVASANAAAKQLQQNNIDSIVVLVHEGGLQGGLYTGCVGISGPIVDIAANLDPAIDLVITGHTHVPYVCTINDPAGQPRQVTSASSFGRVVTETWLTIDKKTRDVVRSATTSTNHLVTRDDCRSRTHRDHRQVEDPRRSDPQPRGRDAGRGHHRRASPPDGGDRDVEPRRRRPPRRSERRPPRRGRSSV